MTKSLVLPFSHFCTLYMNSRLRNWCFTLNNYDGLVDLDLQGESRVEYYVYSEEIGESGTPHLQGYVEFSRAITVGALQRIIPGAHWEPRRGSQAQAIAYCKKEDETHVAGPYEWGTPKAQGSRSDLVAIRDKLIAGSSLKQICLEHPGDYMRYHAGIKSAQQLLKSPKVEKVSFELADFVQPPCDLSKPCVIYGPSGIGKTEFALSHFKAPLMVRHIDDMKELCAVHDGVVFDDFSMAHWPNQSKIHMVDLKESSIHARYGNVVMPAFMPRIFTINEYSDLFGIKKERDGSYSMDSPPDSIIKAIERRINKYFYVDELFK